MTKIGVEYQNYQKSQLMKKLAASAHCGEYRGQTSSAIYPEIASRIKGMSLSPSSRILDAGCGNGAFSRPLAKEFSCFVEGIDLGKELIEEAKELASKENLTERCHFFTGDFADFSVYPKNIFDVVICIGSLYWGHSLPVIFDIWRRVTRPHSQLFLFLNLAYTSLNSEEREAIGETQFIPALTVEYELSQHGWALSEWQDASVSYIQWLERWCHKMEELSPYLSLEMGNDNASQLIRRFTTYLSLANNQVVRRIILRAEHV